MPAPILLRSYSRCLIQKRLDIRDARTKLSWDDQRPGKWRPGKKLRARHLYHPTSAYPLAHLQKRSAHLACVNHYVDRVGSDLRQLDDRFFSREMKSRLRCRQHMQQDAILSRQRVLDLMPNIRRHRGLRPRHGIPIPDGCGRPAAIPINTVSISVSVPDGTSAMSASRSDNPRRSRSSKAMAFTTWARKCCELRPCRSIQHDLNCGLYLRAHDRDLVRCWLHRDLPLPRP